MQLQIVEKKLSTSSLGLESTPRSPTRNSMERHRKISDGNQTHRSEKPSRTLPKEIPQTHVTKRIEEKADPFFKKGQFSNSAPEFHHHLNEPQDKDTGYIPKSNNHNKKNLPPLNLLTIQDTQGPIIIDGRSFLSPRIMDKRQSDLNSIFAETYEIKGLQGLDLIQDVTKSNKLDKKLNEYLQKNWSASLRRYYNSDKLEALQDRINDSYKVFLAREIDALYTFDKLEFKHFLVDHSPRVVQLIELIQKAGVPFKNIFPRFRLLRSLIDNYLWTVKNKKTGEPKKMMTAYSIRLYTYLNRFLAKQNFLEDKEDLIHDNEEASKSEFKISYGKEIDNFLKIYEEIIHLVPDKKESKGTIDSLKRWGIAPLGENEAERESVLQILREWAANSENDKKKLSDKLKTDTWQISRTSYYISQIATIYHRWVQNQEQCLKPLSHIKYPYIFEKWRRLTTAFDVVRINGMTFWDHRSVKLGVSPRNLSASKRNPRPQLEQIKISDPQTNRPVYTPKQIFENLFMMCSGKEKIDFEVVCDAAEFIAASTDRSFISDDIEKRIPWIPLMRLGTDKAWEEADIYMQKLFPVLFTQPYSIKYDGHCECHININQSEVTQIRGITVFRNFDLENPESIPKEQVNLSMAWCLKPIKIGWKGALWVERYEVFDEVYWLELRPKLVEAVNVDALPDNPKGIKYFSDLPKDLYTKTHSTVKGRSISVNTAIRKRETDFV